MQHDESGFCPQSFVNCLCNATDPDHVVHTCSCGGSWTVNKDGHQVPVMYPGGLTEAEAVEKMALSLGVTIQLHTEDPAPGDTGEGVIVATEVGLN